MKHGILIETWLKLNIKASIKRVYTKIHSFEAFVNAKIARTPKCGDSKKDEKV